MMNDEYREAIAQAKANLEDIRDRGAEALIPWSKIRDKYFTEEEIAASNLRVQLMVELAHTQDDEGIPQHELEPPFFEGFII